MTVRRGAWNTDEHHGWDFHQWQGSRTQRDAMARVHETSTAFRGLLGHALDIETSDLGAWHQLDEARWRLLRAETSCNFYWGEGWVHKAHADLDAAWTAINEARHHLPPPPDAA